MNIFSAHLEANSTNLNNFGFARQFRRSVYMVGKCNSLHTACTGRAKLWDTAIRPEIFASAQRSSRMANVAGHGPAGTIPISAARRTRAERADRETGNVASGRTKRNVHPAAARLISGRTGPEAGCVVGLTRR
jgi:hypothetical protein